MRTSTTLADALMSYWRWMDEHDGVPPTVREWQVWLGLRATSPAHYWLRKLLDHGYVYHAVPSRLESGSKHANDLVLTTEGRERAEGLMLHAATLTLARDLQASVNEVVR